MKPATLGTAHSSDNAQRGIYCVPEKSVDLEHCAGS
jgi:hypothetical protein